MPVLKSIVIIVPPVPRRCHVEHCVRFYEAYPELTIVMVMVVVALAVLWTWFG